MHCTKHNKQLCTVENYSNQQQQQKRPESQHFIVFNTSSNKWRIMNEACYNYDQLYMTIDTLLFIY